MLQSVPGYAEGRVLHQEHSTSKMELHPGNTECSVLLLVKWKPKEKKRIVKKRKEKKKKKKERKNERKKKKGKK